MRGFGRGWLVLSNQSFFYWTGHPFVDAGLAALLLLSEKERPEDLDDEDIKEALRFVSEIYMKPVWRKYLSRIFRNNNPILMINPSMKSNLSQDNLYSSLYGLYNLIMEGRENKGFCEVCGRYSPVDPIDLRGIILTKDKNKPKEVTGDIFPLLGTGDLPNFFSAGSFLGANICAHCLFLSQISPMGMYPIASKKGGVSGVLCVHVYPYDKMLEFIADSIKDARISYSTPNSKGYEKTENFIVNKIIKITQRLNLEQRLGFWKDVKITLYLFLNGNRTNEQRIEIIRIPTSTTMFIAYATTYDQSGWNTLISKSWIDKPKKLKKPEKLETSFKNAIYNNLIHGESILGFFVDRKERSTNTKWELLEFYCKEVLGMDEKALELIKDVGDRIIETLEQMPDNKLNKRVRYIENADRLYQFENFFLIIEKDRQKLGIKDSLISFDEFTQLLVNYGENIGESWKTVKNLILFRIYEKMHNRIMKIPKEETEGGDEE